jgi:hypothetical protein
MPFKKIFKPVAKVLDKVIPNEIKPALPYLAAFAPVFGPASVQGFIGDTMLRRALVSGALNVGAQLSQEGSEGDINLLSAGLGALSGAMTAPGAAETFRGAQLGTPGATGADAGFYVSRGLDVPASQVTGLQKAANFGLEGLAKGSEMLAAGAADPFSKAGLKAATLPFTTATGDVMEAEARRLNKQAIIDQALDGLEEGFSNADASQAIRLAMLQYGFSDDEISETIAAAGYKVGGRVGYRFGGIDAALDKVEDEDIKESVKMVADMPDMDLMDLIEEFEITFKRKPVSMEELKQFYRENYEMESPIKLKEKIKEKITMEAKDGGLMDLGGKEMDLRGGGFVPIGKKERADDVPARLSKNEFVMTADAVRAAGGGSVNKGAKRMYDLMNNLEARA